MCLSVQAATEMTLSLLRSRGSGGGLGDVLAPAAESGPRRGTLPVSGIPTSCVAALHCTFAATIPSSPALPAHHETAPCSDTPVAEWH